MQITFNIEERKPIWIAISGFYLDTELEDSDFDSIAKKILESPYSFEDVVTIDKNEIYPVLIMNKNSVAGTWEGFDEISLIEAIASRLKNKSIMNDLGNEISYFLNNWMSKRYWKKLRKAYNSLKANKALV